MSSKPIISLSNINKTFFLYNSPKDRLKQTLWRGRRNFFTPANVLKNINLDIYKGETIGIVGSNGSGKSTLLQIICGVLEPSSGQCVVDGRVSALLELGAGFNPDFTGKENVYLNGAILGLTKEEVDERYEDIVAFSGIGEKVNQPVKTYSSGMYVRLAFSVAVAIDPDILIVDEALAVGDELFQRKCFARIRDIKERGGTILFVSHAAQSILDICDRAILMDAGEVILSGSPKFVISQYHKLIFAPAEKRSTIRMELMQPALQDKAELPVSSECDEEKDVSPVHYDPALIPESQVVYASQGAVISDLTITALDGTPVNLLRRGEDYIYSYEVRFNAPAKQVRFGMLIKTKSGVELGGMGTASEEGGIPEVQPGESIRVSFRFPAALVPGLYFLNCGCSSIEENNRVFLHRIVDACMFRVLPETELMLGGVVDFGITSSLEWIAKDK